MSWLTEQLDLLRDFLRTDFRRTARRCALGMAAAAVLGVALTAMEPEVVEDIMNGFMRQIQEAGVIDETGNLSVFAMLTNNWMAMLFSALYGFIPFLFLPLFSLLANGSLLGMMAVIYLANDLSLAAYLAGILPHGIFELPALVLSISCGVCLCGNMCRLVTGSDRRIPMVELLSDLLRVMLLVVLPLTVLAAVMECYVTPVVMGLFM